VKNAMRNSVHINSMETEGIKFHFTSIIGNLT
jgi:hypothetical protein